MDDMTKVRKAIFMFTDLFGMERFEYRTVVTFFLGENVCPANDQAECRSYFAAVKQSYRNVVYHNFTHGFHVANSIYSILKVPLFPRSLLLPAPLSPLPPAVRTPGLARHLQPSGEPRNVCRRDLP
jgi:hypothetical protein